jgi:hypothetical protein
MRRASFAAAPPPTPRSEGRSRFGLTLRAAVAALAVGTLLAGCSYHVLFWERNIWQDTKAIFAIVEPADPGLYRELLPQQFSMPDQPMVGLYVADFVDTEPWPITATEFLFPYLEASVLLRCEYQGRIGWYSHVMPVSTEAAMIGGRRLGFPKYVADEIRLEPTAEGWQGTVVHKGRERISLRFAEVPLDAHGPLSPLEEEFASGRGDAANLREPIILLNPPGEGPDVNVLPISPPPLAERRAGSVRISLSEPYDRLVPAGTMAVGLYQRFTLPGGGGPPWIVVALFLAALMGLTWWMLRRLRARRR